MIKVLLGTTFLKRTGKPETKTCFWSFWALLMPQPRLEESSIFVDILRTVDHCRPFGKLYLTFRRFASSRCQQNSAKQCFASNVCFFGGGF